MCALVLSETSLLPHVNAGIMTDEELARLRKVSVSQGIMLETAAERLRNAADRISARRTKIRRAARQ